MIGIWERVNILIFMLWVIVFAIVLIGKNYLIKWAKEHPVTMYYLLTFLISWGGLTIIAGGPNGISPNYAIKSFLPVYLITVAGPFISGLLMVGLYDGIKGYREFVSRLFKWRVHAKWYLAAIFVTPITVFSALLMLSFISPAFQPAIFGSEDSPVAASFGISEAGIIELFLFVLMLGRQY